MTFYLPSIILYLLYFTYVDWSCHQPANTLNHFHGADWTVLGLPMTSAGSYRLIGSVISQLALGPGGPMVSNEEWTCHRLETPRCRALRIHDDWYLVPRWVPRTMKEYHPSWWIECGPAGPALSPECSQKFTDLAEHKNQTFEKHQTRLSIYKEVQLHGELSGAISDG
jgi:hypothetical protein